MVACELRKVHASVACDRDRTTGSSRYVPGDSGGKLVCGINGKGLKEGGREWGMEGGNGPWLRGGQESRGGANRVSPGKGPALHSRLWLHPNLGYIGKGGWEA